MKKTILLLFLLLSINVFSQKNSVDLNKISLSDYIEKEKDYVGGKILNSDCSTIYDELGLLSYIRSDNNIPDVDLIVRYIYFKNDSLVIEIRNEWDIANHNKKLDNHKDLKFRKDLVAFYSMLEQNLQNRLGKGKVRDKIPTKINEEDTYSKTNEWTLGNTIIKLNITMSNNYNIYKNQFPTHKIIFSYRAVNIENKPDYRNKKLLKRDRKALTNIGNPIISSREPTFPRCENSTDKIGCMNNEIRKLILQKIKEKNILIKNDTLKIGFLVQKDGEIRPRKSSIKSTNQELEKIGMETINNLPKIIPSYSERVKQNVSFENSFYIIIANNKITNFE